MLAPGFEGLRPWSLGPVLSQNRMADSIGEAELLTAQQTGGKGQRKGQETNTPFKGARSLTRPHLLIAGL